MATFQSNNIDVTPSKFINTYLVNMPIYGKNIVTKDATEGYYHISYDKIDEAVAYRNSSVYSDPNFKITDIYFTPLIHDNIANVSDDNGLPNLIGEIIFKAVTTTSSDIPLYLCYLVQSVNRGKGTDDAGGQSTGSLSIIYSDIISTSTAGQINYKGGTTASTTVSPGTDGTIPIQDKVGAIVYTDKKVIDPSTTKSYYVCVFLNPITVSNPRLMSFFNSLSVSSSFFINKYPTNGNLEILTGTAQGTPHGKQGSGTQESGTKESDTKESGTQGTGPDSQIYIDCSPTGVGEDTIASYNLPINSTLMQDIQNSSFSQLCSNFILFSIILAASFIGIPILYRMAIEKKGLSDSDRTSVKRFSKPFSIVILIVVSIILFAQGQATNNMAELLAGFLLIFLSVLTYILLSTEEAALGINPGDMFSFEFLTFFLGVLTRIAGQWKFISGLLILLVVILVILSFAVKKVDGNPVVTFPGDFFTIFFLVGFIAIPSMVGFITWVS